MGTELRSERLAELRRAINSNRAQQYGMSAVIGVGEFGRLLDQLADEQGSRAMTEQHFANYAAEWTVERASLRADLNRAEQALKAVREAHPPITVPYPVRSFCGGCRRDWPCPTVTAINDAFTVTSPPHVREWLAGAEEPPADAAAVDDRAELQRRRDELASDG